MKKGLIAFGESGKKAVADELKNDVRHWNT
jgi:hypothetical protein